MATQGILAAAWNNGAHHVSGAGYGLKISAADRDAHFKREWKTVALHLPAPFGRVEVNTDKASFWNDTCRELICREIGAWLIRDGNGRWPTGKPPSFELRPRGTAAFDVVPACAAK